MTSNLLKKQTANTMAIGHLSKAVWGILTLWVVYSLGALAWHMLNNPLFDFVCRTR